MKAFFVFLLISLSFSVSLYATEQEPLTMTHPMSVMQLQAQPSDTIPLSDTLALRRKAIAEAPYFYRSSGDFWLSFLLATFLPIVVPFGGIISVALLYYMTPGRSYSHYDKQYTNNPYYQKYFNEEIKALRRKAVINGFLVSSALKLILGLLFLLLLFSAFTGI